MPAYEDQPYFLMREGRLPANVVAEASQAADPQERARLLRVFSQGLDAVVGYVLPLRRFGAGPRRRWQSEAWEMREGKIFLVQGDSSMGVRLPLAACPMSTRRRWRRRAGARSARRRRAAAAACGAARAGRASSRAAASAPR